MPFVDNTVKNAQETEVGLKISKPGFDANRTAGNNLIFSSSWPSLPIAFETTIPNPGAGAFTITHNLGFPPLMFLWAYGPDPSGVGNTSVRLQVSHEIDSTKVYLNSVTFPTGTTYIHVKCFQLDLRKDVDYILAPGDTFSLPYDSSFGIKIVKQFKDIESRDYRDFAIHSRCQSPLILAVKTQATVSPSNPTTVQYTVKTGEAVWVYGYILISAGRYRYSPFTGVSPENVGTNGVITNVSWSTGIGHIGATLVILRDPLFAPTSSTVQY